MGPELLFQKREVWARRPLQVAGQAPLPAPAPRLGDSVVTRYWTPSRACVFERSLCLYSTTQPGFVFGGAAQAGPAAKGAAAARVLSYKGRAALDLSEPPAARCSRKAKAEGEGEGEAGDEGDGISTSGDSDVQPLQQGAASQCTTGPPNLPPPELVLQAPPARVYMGSPVQWHNGTTLMYAARDFRHAGHFKIEVIGMAEMTAARRQLWGDDALPARVWRLGSKVLSHSTEYERMVWRAAFAEFDFAGATTAQAGAGSRERPAAERRDDLPAGAGPPQYWASVEFARGLRQARLRRKAQPGGVQPGRPTLHCFERAVMGNMDRDGSAREFEGPGFGATRTRGTTNAACSTTPLQQAWGVIGSERSGNRAWFSSESAASFRAAAHKAIGREPPRAMDPAQRPRRAVLLLRSCGDSDARHARCLARSSVAEVTALLQRLGAEVATVKPDEASLHEVAEAVSGAGLIIGLFGSQVLVNLHWARPGAAVLEITPHLFWESHSPAGSLLGLHYFVSMARPSEEDQRLLGPKPGPRAAAEQQLRLVNRTLRCATARFHEGGGQRAAELDSELRAEDQGMAALQRARGVRCREYFFAQAQARADMNDVEAVARIAFALPFAPGSAAPRAGSSESTIAVEAASEDVRAAACRVQYNPSASARGYLLDGTSRA